MIEFTEEDVTRIGVEWNERLKSVEQEVKDSSNNEELTNYLYMLQEWVIGRTHEGWRSAIQQGIEVGTHKGLSGDDIKEYVGLL